MTRQAEIQALSNVALSSRASKLNFDGSSQPDDNPYRREIARRQAVCGPGKPWFFHYAPGFTVEQRA